MSWPTAATSSTLKTCDHFALHHNISVDDSLYLTPFLFFLFTEWNWCGYYHAWALCNPEASSPPHMTQRPLTRSYKNRCKNDWVISGLGGCRPPLCGRREEVLINRLVAMSVTHTSAGTLPSSSWITHQSTELDISFLTFDLGGLTRRGRGRSPTPVTDTANLCLRWWRWLCILCIFDTVYTHLN